MEINKTIYKVDTKGKMRYLEVSTFEGALVQISGIVGTDSPIKHEKFCEGKNIGRSNETTAKEQAVSQAESLIKEKMTGEYFSSQEAAENGVVVMPMLAKDFNKEIRKLRWGKETMFVQPKFDGMRCLSFVHRDLPIKMMSRTGKEILGMDHIRKELEGVRARMPLDVNLIILDGELYVHGENFQNNMRFIKKYKEGHTERIKYNVYDIVEDKVFEFRKVRPYIVGFTNLLEVSTYLIKSKEELDVWHKEFLKQGYEGTMVRLNNEGYKKNGRSSELLKYKDFLDLSLKIIDIVANENRPEQGTAVFEHNGNLFKSGMKYSHADRIDMLKNKDRYIGKTAELRFFEYSESGTPRFPIMVGIRLDK